MLAAASSIDGVASAMTLLRYPKRARNGSRATGKRVLCCMEARPAIWITSHKRASSCSGQVFKFGNRARTRVCGVSKAAVPSCMSPRERPTSCRRPLSHLAQRGPFAKRRLADRADPDKKPNVYWRYQESSPPERGASPSGAFNMAQWPVWERSPTGHLNMFLVLDSGPSAPLTGG